MPLLQVPNGIGAVGRSGDDPDPQMGPGRNQPNDQGTFNRVWITFFNHLATKINNADNVASVSTANAASAPGAYSQSHIQTIVDELNSTKAQLNAIISALNT